MRIIGEKVIIRDTVTTDLLNSVIWQIDEEIRRLDPVAGTPVPALACSIDSLDGVHIGTCSLYDFIGNSIQLGIRIGNRDYWNRGYGTEAAFLLVQYAFEVMIVGRVWLKVLPENIRAIRCYEKAGFRKYGRLALNGYEFVVMEVLR